MWGPIIHGPGPSALRESKGPSRGEPRPKLYNAEHQTVFVVQPRTTQSSADPKPHQKKKGKPGIGPNLKENLRISGKATLIAVQCAVPDGTVLFSFINHPQQFRDWTDGTNVSFVKTDPTRGRRTANAG